jgi:hypothetical protein
MKDQKKLAGRTLYRAWCFVFTAVVLFVLLLMAPSQAAAQEKPLFTGNEQLFNNPYEDGDRDDNGLFSNRYLSWSGNMPDRRKPRVSTLTFFGEFCLGVVGNVAGGYGGGLLGYHIDAGDDKGGWFNGLGGALVGYSVGSTIGSALGVSIIGNSRDVRGSFGRAILGSLAGEGAAILLALVARNETVALIAFIALPPLGAAVFFNSSLRYKSPPLSSALFNFDKGDFKIGIPFVRVQPLPRLSKQQKPTVSVNVNLLSIAL